MKAGRKLDALVAKKVMGWKRNRSGPLAGRPKMWKELPFAYVGTPRFSTDIAAAWEVVEKLGNWHGFDFMVWRKDGEQWRAGWFEDDYGGPESRASAEADTVPLAICLAALEAVGYDPG